QRCDGGPAWAGVACSMSFRRTRMRWTEPVIHYAVQAQAAAGSAALDVLYVAPSRKRTSRSTAPSSSFFAAWYSGLSYVAIAFSTESNSITTDRSFTPAS